MQLLSFYAPQHEICHIQYLICLSELHISRWRLNLTTWIRAWRDIIEMCIYETEVNDLLTLIETFVFLIPFLTNANSAMWEKSPMLWKDQKKKTLVIRLHGCGQEKRSLNSMQANLQIFVTFYMHDWIVIDWNKQQWHDFPKCVTMLNEVILIAWRNK